MSYTWAGLPSKSIQKLQLVQSAVMWAVMCTKTNVTYLLCELHCCQFAFVSNSRCCILIFTTLYDMGPGYLRDCLYQLHLLISSNLARQTSCRFRYSGNYIWQAWAAKPSLLWLPPYGMFFPLKWFSAILPLFSGSPSRPGFIIRSRGSQGASEILRCPLLSKSLVCFFMTTLDMFIVLILCFAICHPESPFMRWMTT